MRGKKPIGFFCKYICIIILLLFQYERIEYNIISIVVVGSMGYYLPGIAVCRGKTCSTRVVPETCRPNALFRKVSMFPARPLLGNQARWNTQTMVENLSRPEKTTDYDLIMEKYDDTTSAGTSLDGKTQNGSGMRNGVFSMLLVNFALHAVVYFWNPAILQSLALSHMHPEFWQFVTAAFVHANWDHLFGNAFSLLVFGRMVEEEEGAFGLWATYIICGISGNLASYLSSPGTASVSLGASSAVFGLFVVGVLSKFRPSIRQLLEAAILGSYVVKQVLQEVQMVTSGSSVVAGAMTVGHMAHLGGALGGVLLVLFLSRLPPI